MFEVEHYSLSVDINPFRQPAERLSAEIEIRARNLLEETRSLTFYLYEEFSITSLTCVNQEITWQRSSEHHPHQYAGTTVNIAFSRAVQAKEEITLAISYKGNLGRIVWGYCMIKPHLVELRDFACWYPMLAENNQSFTYDMTLSLPARYQALTNGSMVPIGDCKPGETRWKSDDSVTDINIVASPLFRSIIKSTQGRTGSIYYAYLSDKQAEQLLDQSLAVIDFYTDLMGPNEKVADLVWAYCPRFAEGGYVYGKLATMSEMMYIYMLNHPEEARKFSACFGNSHETAHFWWRGQVTVDRSTYHDWLIEALTEYVASEADRLLGKRDVSQELYARYEKNVNSMVSSQPMTETLFNSKNRYTMWYEKGAWILRMLSCIVGEDTMQQILKRFYVDNKGGIVTTEDFQKCCESMYGKSLEWFFCQWLQRTELPSFECEARPTSDSKLQIYVQQTSTECLRFPLTFEMETKDHTIKRTVWIKDSQHCFEFDIDGQVCSVVCDPDYEVLLDTATRNRCKLL